MFFEILAAIAEFEHALMSERTLDGPGEGDRIECGGRPARYERRSTFLHTDHSVRNGCGSARATGRSWRHCCTGCRETCCAGCDCRSTRTRYCAGTRRFSPADTRPPPSRSAPGR
ncbi:hypothetical protein, partial [Saccharopolyspora shandongensis]|uniref:hypothetical protein n=1 Tax=Saccharopolyspora shandongensis TaxID=418495 RepID=UPI0033F566E0